MSDLLAVGATGLRAYQTSLTTVSENIANASTPGYARRSTDLREVTTVGGGLTSIGATTGSGVRVAGVSRSSDVYRNAAVRTAGADLARTQTSAAWLDRIEGALTNNQLGSQLTGFFNAAKGIAADPTAGAPRNVFLETAAGVAGAFGATARSLDQIATDLDITTGSAVASANAFAASLAKVNDGLGRAAPGTTQQASLLDQRDQLLDQLSAIGDIGVTFDNLGRTTVTLGAASGPVLVQGVLAGRLDYARNASGAISFAVTLGGQQLAASPNGGALGGIAEGAQRIADARTEIDRIATDFVAGVNAQQAAGRDLDGNAGAPLFTAGASPAEFSVALTSARGIAAAAVGGGPRDNGNISAFESLRTSGAFEADTANLIAGNAATLTSRKTVAEAQGAIRDGAIAARDQVSGVNLDNEAIDLLRFQQAYQASSRVIQVARDTLQTLFDLR